MLKVNVLKEEEYFVINLSGCLDYFTVGILKESLEELGNLDNSKLFFSFKNLTFMDSSGVGGFLNIVRNNPSCKVEFINLDKGIENIFELVGFFQIQNTIQNKHYISA